MCLHPVITLEPNGSRSPVVSITAHFAELKDPRLDRTKAHTLLDILVIAICAIICGAKPVFDRHDLHNVGSGQ